MRCEAGIEREATRRAEHRRRFTRKARAIGLVADGAGTARDGGGVGLRIGQEGCEQHRIVARERIGGLAEQAEGGGADALRLAAKPGEIEIGLEDLVLRPARFEAPRGTHLAELVPEMALAGRSEIGREEARDLHRQRARAACALAPCLVARDTGQCEQVDAAMAEEALVLDPDDCFAGDRRDVVERGPAEPPRGKIDPRAVDQRAVTVVEPRFGRVPGAADLRISGKRRGQGRVIDREEGEDGER